jgi:hypothetical protein
MKSFKEIINERKSLKTKWVETPDYTAKRMLNDYKYKFYETDHEISNEILYLMLIDIMDKLDEIEDHILKKEDTILKKEDNILKKEDDFLTNQEDILIEQ